MTRTLAYAFVAIALMLWVLALVGGGYYSVVLARAVAGSQTVPEASPTLPGGVPVPGGGMILILVVLGSWLLRRGERRFVTGPDAESAIQQAKRPVVVYLNADYGPLFPPPARGPEQKHRQKQQRAVDHLQRQGFVVIAVAPHPNAFTPVASVCLRPEPDAWRATVDPLIARANLLIVAPSTDAKLHGALGRALATLGPKQVVAFLPLPRTAREGFRFVELLAEQSGGEEVEYPAGAEFVQFTAAGKPRLLDGGYGALLARTAGQAHHGESDWHGRRWRIWAICRDYLFPRYSRLASSLDEIRGMAGVEAPGASWKPSVLLFKETPRLALALAAGLVLLNANVESVFPQELVIEEVTTEASSELPVAAGDPPSREVDAALNPRILIEGGTFVMGTDDDPMADDYEKPAHAVTLSSFLLQAHEVTNAEYRRFEPGHAVDEPDDDPAVRVSWYEAKAYAEWLGGNLPTEAQWELAARGTEGRRFPWGEGLPSCEHARVAGCTYGLARASSNFAGATPEGVLGLAGNAWEWTLDRFAGYPEDAGSPVDPTGPVDGTARTVRGGSYLNADRFARGTHREAANPGRRQRDIGFRVAWPAGSP